MNLNDYCINNSNPTMDKNRIFKLIKTECGRTKYEMLASKKGLFNRIRLYWFIVFAIIEDWNLKS